MDSAAVWDLPGRVSLRPSGRLRVDAPCSAQEGFWVGKNKMPPSAFRVRCWQQMDAAAEIAPTLAPKKSWRSVEDLLALDRARDAGRAYVRRIETLAELLDPALHEHLIARLLSGTADDGPITPFLAERVLLFASYVWHVCLVEQRPMLVGALHKLAALLGCGHRSACTVVALADRKGLVRRVPQREECPDGFVDRDGKLRMQRRDTNAYGPGVVMQVAWMRDGRPQRPKAPPVPSVVTGAPVRESAQAPGIPRGSREDRTGCDPGPRHEVRSGGVSDEAGAAPAPPPAPTRPAPSPAQDAVPARDREQARGFAASQGSVALGGGLDTAPPPLERRTTARQRGSDSPRQGATAPPGTGGAEREAAGTDAAVHTSGDSSSTPRSLAEQGQARGLTAASRPPPSATPHPGDSPSGRRGQLTGERSKMRASDGATAHVRAAAGHVVTPDEARLMPAWYRQQLVGVMGASNPHAAAADLFERAHLWLRLTQGGTPAHEADALVERLRRGQARRRKQGGAGGVCPPQPTTRRGIT